MIPLKGAYYAIEGDVCQLITVMECQCHAFVMLRGYVQEVEISKIETILTTSLSLAAPLDQIEIDACVHDIHKEHGHVAAAYAVRDLWLRSKFPDWTQVRMIALMILINESEVNPQHVWKMSEVQLRSLIYQFTRQRHEVS